MNDSIPSDQIQNKKILEKLNSLESRISRIETHLRLITRQELYEAEEEEELRRAGSANRENVSFESRMVEYGLTWLSTIIYLFGIIFLMSYIRNAGHPIAATFTGYLAVGGLFIFTYLLRKSFARATLLFLHASGILLAYFITVKLHFFIDDPAIQSLWLSILLMSVTILALVIYAIRQKSEFLGFISLITLLITGIILDSTFITLSYITLSAALSLYYFIKLGWWRQLTVSIFLVYLSHMIWLFGNPVMGHSMQAVESHQHNIIFLFLYGIMYSSTMITADKARVSDNVLGVISVINAINFSVFISMVALIYYKENYAWIFGIISVSCLIYSIALKRTSATLFAAALYACFGFVALSICIYGFAGLPASYYWLALQSLVVVSFALWFRSQIIVVANTLLYVIILLIYLINSESMDTINFVFAIVALVTARILNWKKERLTLKTEVYRNIYLLIGFAMVLYAFSEAVPTAYVALSWTGLAILFLVLSIILKNFKYRWMSFLTIISTGVHIMFVDMAKMDMGLKVVTFLLFAAITIGLSLYYTKWIKKKSSS